MIKVKLTLNNDPMTLGPNADMEDLYAYAENLTELVSEEFDVDCDYTLKCCAYTEVTCDCEDTRQQIDIRISQISGTDEWLDLLRIWRIT